MFWYKFLLFHVINYYNTQVSNNKCHDLYDDIINGSFSFMKHAFISSYIMIHFNLNFLRSTSDYDTMNRYIILIVSIKRLLQDN